MAKGKGLQKHESSECRKGVVSRWREIPSTVKGDIGEMISAQHALENYNSRRNLIKILGNVRYLARQALPLRGDWRTTEKSVVDSNFYQFQI